MLNTTIYSPLEMMERILSNQNSLVPTREYFIREEDKYYSIEIPVPGYKNKDVSVELEGNTLVIEGTGNDSHWTQDFIKRFKIPNSVNSDKIKAVINDGVLEISLDKREESLPRKIKIS
jgi:HSP20 family protein